MEIALQNHLPKDENYSEFCEFPGSPGTLKFENHKSRIAMIRILRGNTRKYKLLEETKQKVFFHYFHKDQYPHLGRETMDAECDPENSGEYDRGEGWCL